MGATGFSRVDRQVEWADLGQQSPSSKPFQVWILSTPGATTK